MSYASFVEDVAPDRADDLDLRLTREQRDQVVFLAGIIYVRDLVAGQLALAEAATGRGKTFAANVGVNGLRLGTAELRPNSGYVIRLRRLRAALNEQLTKTGVPPTANRLSDAIVLVAGFEEG